MALPVPTPRRGHPLRHLLRKEPVASTSPAHGTHHLKYLGTAGFVVEAAGRVMVLDPYLSRPGITQTLFGRLPPDEALLHREIPRATEVLCGHSHHDHALDAPAVCKLTGARLIGSAATLNIGRAYGLPEAQLVEMPASGGEVACGEASARACASRHGRVYFGRVTLPGDIPRPPAWPPRVTDLRHGPVYTWHLRLGDTSLVHVDSADYVEEELAGVRADVLCLCAIGRVYRKDYVKNILEIVRPKVVIPCHWDDFTLPYDTPPRQLPGVDVEGFVEEIRRHGAEPVVLGFGQRWSW